MRVLWVGDAVVSSGFAACTHAACDELHARGHEVHVLGINYHGDPHGYPYKVYPCYQPLDHGGDGFGIGRLPHLVHRLRPDVVVLLNDPWNVKPYLHSLRQLPDDFKRPLMVGWMAVDGKNQRGWQLNGLDHVTVWTEFAKQELTSRGMNVDCDVVPLGVGPEFAPLDKVESRTLVFPPNLPVDAFVVGVVGRNQPRKRLDLSIEYFAEWVTKRDVKDAYLYLHVGPTGDVGVDVASLVTYYGMQGRVVMNEPPLGRGSALEHMVRTYSSFDVYLTTSQGEGWGLPCLEAMACGVPCVVPDWSGLGDWTRDAAVKVPCSSTALTAPMNGLMYTVGGVPDKRATVSELDALYRSEAHRSVYVKRGLKMAASLPWSAAGAGMTDVLERVFAASLPAPEVLDEPVVLTAASG